MSDVEGSGPPQHSLLQDPERSFDDVIRVRCHRPECAHCSFRPISRRKYCPRCALRPDSSVYLKSNQFNDISGKLEVTNFLTFSPSSNGPSCIYMALSFVRCWPYSMRIRTHYMYGQRIKRTNIKNPRVSLSHHSIIDSA